MTTARWFALMWNLPVMRAQLLRDAASSAGQHNVSLSAAKRYCFPLPPLAEQDRILRAVDELTSAGQAAIGIAQRNVARAANLKRSILRAAFDGWLVDREPVDESPEALLQRVQAARAWRGASTKRPSRRASRAANGTAV
jgi:type I restriction enzyme S subunit